MIHVLCKHVKVGSVLLAAAIAAGCSKTPDPTSAAAQLNPATGKALLKVGFQLDWYPAPEHGGEYEAVVKNYYRDAGLDVTIIAGGPDSYGIQKVATGRVEMSTGACDDVVLAVKRGAPLLIVGAHLEHNPQAVMVHEDSPVRSFRDLNGKSVMCVVGSTWIDYVESHYGIAFSVVPADYGLARFMSDRNFIQQCYITNEPYFAELHGVKTRSFLISESGYDPYRVIFTSKAFARDHPEAVRAFVACTARGWHEYMHGDAAPARARIQSENPSQSQALMDFSIAAMTRYHLVEGDPAKGEGACLISRGRIASLMQDLVDLKIMDAAPPIDGFVSFDFLPPEPKAAKT